MNNKENQQMLRWCVNNPMKALSCIAVVGSLAGSFALAQYQISELRRHQEYTQSRMAVIDTSIPVENRRRIDKLESHFEELRSGQSIIHTELSVVRTIVERIEKKM